MNDSDLTRGSISHHLYRMSAPMLVGLIANLSIQVIDTWFIAQLGPQPLAAMGFIFPIVTLIMSLSIGLSAGAASLIARNISVTERSQLKKLVSDTQLLAFILACLAAVLGWLTMDWMFIAMGAPETLLPLIRDYMEIYYINSVFAMLAMVGLSSTRATGNANIQGMVMLIGAGINAVLDPLLIFGLAGFPRLEMQGAALASFVSRVFTFAAAYYYLNKLNLLSWPHRSWRDLKETWAPLTHVSIPSTASNLIMPISATLVTALVARYGESAVAGMGVGMRIEGLLLIGYYALSSAIGPFAGHNFSNHRFQRLAASVNITAVFCLVLGAVVAGVLLFLADPLVGLFSDDETVKRVAKAYLLIVPMSYGCFGIVMCVNALFNGLGQAMIATLITVIRVMIFYLPFAYIGAYYYQINGIFVAATIANVLAAIVSIIWFRRVYARMTA